MNDEDKKAGITLIDSIISASRDRKKRQTILLVRKAFKKATRQELTPLLQKEGWSNLDIIEILEGVDSEDIL